MPSVTIGARFNGPQGSANGGYACGVVAELIDGPARVRLHRPPPLGRELAVRVDDGGTEVTVHDDGVVIATAAPTRMAGTPPPAPSLEEAVDARARYRGLVDHIYPHCFVCGPKRARGDGLGIFAGPLADRDDVVACDWCPPDDARDRTGALAPRLVWAALDCPSYFALDVDPTQPLLLGQMSAALEPEIPADRRGLVVYAWRVAQDGRKHSAGAALADGAGRIWARAEHVWIAPAPRI